MLPNSPDFVGSLPIQDRKPDHPYRHFKKPDLTKIRFKGYKSDKRVKCVLI